MKYITIIIALFLLSTIEIFAQTQTDSIEIRKNIFGTVCRQNGRILTEKRLINITRVNDEAYQEMKISKNNSNIAKVVGFLGGAMVGWPLGAATAGKKMDWNLFGIGAGLIAVSIPFSLASIRHAKKAVKIYNEGINQTSLHAIEFNMAVTVNGIGIVMTF
jgi:hypothetical protein